MQCKLPLQNCFLNEQKSRVIFISNLFITLHFKVLVLKIIGSQDELLKNEQNHFAVVVVDDDTAVVAVVVDVTAAVVTV